MACFWRGKMFGSAMLRCSEKLAWMGAGKGGRMKDDPFGKPSRPFTGHPFVPYRLLVGRASGIKPLEFCFLLGEELPGGAMEGSGSPTLAERRYNRDATRNTEKIKVDQSESNLGNGGRRLSRPLRLAFLPLPRVVARSGLDPGLNIFHPSGVLTTCLPADREVELLPHPGWRAASHNQLGRGEKRMQKIKVNQSESK